MRQRTRYLFSCREETPTRSLEFTTCVFPGTNDVSRETQGGVALTTCSTDLAGVQAVWILMDKATKICPPSMILSGCNLQGECHYHIAVNVRAGVRPSRKTKNFGGRLASSYSLRKRKKQPPLAVDLSASAYLVTVHPKDNPVAERDQSSTFRNPVSGAPAGRSRRGARHIST